MKGTMLSRVYIGLIGCVLLFGGTSCDDSFIDPFENEDHYFTIYGYLDALESTQRVRVVPVQRIPERIETLDEATLNFGAFVTSIDLRDSTVVRWQHTVQQLTDGTYGHVFEAKMRPLPGRTYRLEVTRTDGSVTWAETTVPRIAATVPNPDTLFFPYEVSPDQGLAGDVYLPNIASPWDITVTYDLQGTFIRLPYERPGTRTDDGGWLFSIDMGADAPRMRASLGLSETAPLPLLHAILLDVRVLDGEWDPPGGVFDPDVLALPGTLSNVHNGYGFFGSVGLYQYTWIAPPNAQ